jgi:hypothetical protein
MTKQQIVSAAIAVLGTTAGAVVMAFQGLPWWAALIAAFVSGGAAAVATRQPAA